MICRSRSHPGSRPSRPLAVVLAAAAGVIGTGAVPVPHVLAVVDTWTGGSTSAWSSSANWTTGVPGPGDTATFPLPVVGVPDNDVLGATVGVLDIAGGHRIIGNSLGLAAGLVARPGVAVTDGVALQLPLSLAGSQTWTLQQGAVLQMDGSVDLGAHVLTLGGSGTAGLHGQLSGSGALVVDGPFAVIDGPTSSIGPITLSSGVLNVAGDTSASPVTQHGGVLAGDGTVGAVDTDGGVLSGGGDVGRLSIQGGLTMHPGAQLSAQLLGPVPATQYDQIRVTGAVDLGAAALFVNVGTVTIGQQFVIVDDDGIDPVTGTLRAALDNQANPIVVRSLAEGATFVVDGTTLSISYAGGTGNDVVLTVVGLPSPATTTSASTTSPMEPTTTDVPTTIIPPPATSPGGPTATTSPTAPPATASPAASPSPVELPRTGARIRLPWTAGGACGAGLLAVGLARRRGERRTMRR